MIFLASHDESGSAGFILNRPTSMRLGDLLEGDTLPLFRENPLYLGGDVGMFTCRYVGMFVCSYVGMFVCLHVSLR